MKVFSLCISAAVLCLATGKEDFEKSVASYTGIASNTRRTMKCAEFLRKTFEVYGKLEACVMDGRANLDSPGFIFAEDLNLKVKGVSFEGSYDNYYLPEQVNGTFPNLVVYDASRCSLKAIKYENFIGLRNMEWINLENNELVKIPNNTFQDMPNLKYLNMDRNRILFMHGEIFNGLTKLIDVHFRVNECIDEDFTDETRIKELPKVVSRHCGYCSENYELSNCALRNEYNKKEDEYRNQREVLQNMLIESSEHAYDGFGSFYTATVNEAAKVTTMVDVSTTKYNSVKKGQEQAEAAAKAAVERLRRALIEKENFSRVNLNLNVKSMELNGIFDSGSQTMRGLGDQLKTIESQISDQKGRITCIQKKIQILSESTC